MKTSSSKKVIKWIIALLIAAMIGYGGYSYWQITSSMRHANEVIEVMKTLVPNLGVDTGISTGQGRDPLAALSIDQKDIVGCIEAPSIDLMAPVTASGYEEEGFATIVSGSPVKGNLRIIGGRKDVFRKIAKAKPGDIVAFTDIDGVRYNYQVTTQFHLKDWDEADQDLMLCYETDDDTQFVLGCKREQ